MTVFLNTLKRIFQNKIHFALLLILPSVFILPLSLNLNPGVKAVNVGIADLDQTEFTHILTDSLAEQANVQKINDPDDANIETLVFKKVFDYVIIISRGSTARILDGSSPELNGYYLKDSLRTLPVQKYLESFLSSAQTIALAAHGDEAKFLEGLKTYRNEGVQPNYEILSNIDRGKSYTTLGMFVMLMLFISIVYTTLILTDKENKTFYRTLTAPLTLKNYMAQRILGFILISFIQVTVILIVLKEVIGLYLGHSVWEIYLLFLTVSVVCVSLGVAVSSASKSVIQASFLGLFITFPMSFVGGCWWQNSMSTDLIRNIGKFTPVYWAMEGVNKLLNEQGLGAVKGDIAMVLLFAAVFFLLGTWRKEDIAS